MNNLVLGTNIHKAEGFENPVDTGIVYLGFTEATYRGSLPVRVEISERRIDIKVYPQRVQRFKTWTVEKGTKPEQRRYEIVVSDELKLSQWDMDGTPQLRGHRNWDIGGQEKDGPWEIEYIHNQRVAIECLADLSSAVAWLSREAKKLADPTSTYRTLAAQLAKQRRNGRSRREFESGTRQRNRACVLDDCFSEILRAEREVDETSGGDYGSWLPDLSTKQRIAFQAAVYSIAMGEDYPRGGWERKIAEPFSKFTVKGVGYNCPEALEYNTRHDGGILCNMWNMMADSPNRAIIANAAKLLIEAVDMKTVHDASVKKWFQLALETEAHAENAKRAEGAA